MMTKRGSAAIQHQETIGVSEFKARCLKLLEETRRKGKEWIITKKSEPVARVIPIGRVRGSHRGALKGLATLKGDIIHWSSASSWEASS
ncbi:MAG: type II toxin-antitoxin system prevent-host-death family antitoxin [Deltaproteobacteria bacterium]|nr:type II toxin-antitoxin system prevent-host-death family antitoxin [Deltaproteobacteria bacterium]